MSDGIENVNIHVVTTSILMKALRKRQSLRQRLLAELHRPGIHLWNDLIIALWGNNEPPPDARARNYILGAVIKLRRQQYPIVTHWNFGLELLSERQPDGEGAE